MNVNMFILSKYFLMLTFVNAEIYAQSIVQTNYLNPKVKVKGSPKRLPTVLKRNLMSGNTEMGSGVSLKKVKEKLSEFAPTSLAESWDNVGMLVEPPTEKRISKILLTNDLTEDVMEEAISISANLIISYHPPIFVPLKRITNATWKERIIGQCLSNSIALYAPHTSWDVVPGGVNDWLVSAFDCEEVKPLVVQDHENLTPKYNLTVDSTNNAFFELVEKKLALLNIQNVELDLRLLFSEIVSNSSTKYTIECTKEIMQRIIPWLKSDKNLGVKCFYVTPQNSVPEVVTGVGRMCKLKSEITIKEAVEILKKHLNVPFVQIALARRRSLESKIKTIAVVAGSGGSILKHIYCDLKITGEASHHEILDWIHNGSSVIITNHSNSERGFLLKFKEILASKLNNLPVSVVVSTVDADPLNVI